MASLSDGVRSNLMIGVDDRLIDSDRPCCESFRLALQTDGMRLKSEFLGVATHFMWTYLILNTRIPLSVRRLTVVRARSMPASVAIAGFGLVAFGASVLWIWALSNQQQDFRVNRQLSMQRPMAPPTEKALAIPLGFIDRLPPDLQMELVTVELQRAATAAGAVVSSMQFQTQRSTMERLGRAEASLQLKGAYPKAKQVLGEVLARFPNVTLTRLAARQSSPDEAEFTVHLTIWSRPVSAGAAGQADS